MPSFVSLTPVPPDPILGLTEVYNADPRPEKVSLASGVYVDETGRTPILDVVREAESRILLAQTTKVYKPIAGDPAYTTAVRALVLGADHPAIADGRVETLHAPGGTGALRVAADLAHRIRPDATVWLSTPTWPNHPQVFSAAGLATREYPYLGRDGSLDLEGLLGALEEASPGDLVCLHACCHNPTGIDPTPGDWRAIGDAIDRLDLLPLVDFAYQGFGDGLTEDRAGVLELVRPGRELMIASSFSKNFALYDERVGALTLVTRDAGNAVTLLSHAKQVVRANYSNPPAHGGEIVATVFADVELRARWEGEVTMMRDRIAGNRRALVEGLRTAGASGDFDGLYRQRGMFSLLGLSTDQVQRLRDEFAIYLVGAGRVNVAGITSSNLGPVCRALAAVIREPAAVA
jgi:aspartate/tyrosine/aromatic aminotransferase